MNSPKIALIGTAGRDKTKPMDKALWEKMLADAMQHVPEGAHLVSGGAAWADHLAVRLMSMGYAGSLTIHLPAPLENGVFIGQFGTAGSTANYYHDKFSTIIDEDSREEIQLLEDHPKVFSTFQEVAGGYRAMFVRNALIAKDASGCLAYTWGTNGPTGGTLDTWKQISGEKLHVPLQSLY